jgi:hypothetical protein
LADSQTNGGQRLNVQPSARISPRTLMHRIPRASQTSGIRGRSREPSATSLVTTVLAVTLARAITKGSARPRPRCVLTNLGYASRTARTANWFRSSTSTKRSGRSLAQSANSSSFRFSSSRTSSDALSVPLCIRSSMLSHNGWKTSLGYRRCHASISELVSMLYKIGTLNLPCRTPRQPAS